MAMIHLLPAEIMLTIFTILHNIWPAGKYSHYYMRAFLGWVSLSHVCTRWRIILLGSKVLWANSATAFFHRPAIEALLQRAGDTSIIVDLDTLHGNTGGRKDKTAVYDVVVSSDLWSRARKIISHARHAGYPFYTDGMTSALSTKKFKSLTELDIFLPHSLGQLDGLYAPSLRILAVRSDAPTSSLCPISLRCLYDIFTTSPVLESLCLHRVVSTIEPMTSLTGSTERRSLRKVELGAYNEQPLQLISRFFTASDRADVLLDIYDVNDFSSMFIALHYLLAKPDGCGAVTNISVRFKSDRASHASGRGYVYEFHFCAVELEFDDGEKVIFRMDDNTPGWEWRSLAEALEWNSVSSLTLGVTHYSEDDEFPGHYVPALLVEKLGALRTLHIKDKPHLVLLPHIPALAPLQRLVVELPFGVETEDIIVISNWLQSVQKDPNAMEVVLQGELPIDFDDDDYQSSEGPALSQLRALCHVRDERAFRNLRYVRS
ncbi:hypothetical protein PENSPDRAFT_667360 [Peniophora sp. CONT]|nr:hypothetical protein PENSPDRAFT_667360 [Peniophora sp. CONT]